jgi:hypothetical protein
LATAFRARYQVPQAVALFGPFSGRLANEGEELRLESPDAPQAAPRADAGFVPYVVRERLDTGRIRRLVSISSASAEELSLQRRRASIYANEPLNWLASPPTPGRDSVAQTPDRDRDGMPDAWEREHGLNEHNPADAFADEDGDGVANAFEYVSGTDPRDARSALQVETEWGTERLTRIRFRAVAGRSYSLLFRDDLQSGPWFKLTDVAAGATVDRELEIQDPLPQQLLRERYYRLVTPAQPDAD